MRLLIKQDSNSGIPDNDGKTPLHWAASSHDGKAAVRDCVCRLTRWCLSAVISKLCTCITTSIRYISGSVLCDLLTFL